MNKIVVLFLSLVLTIPAMAQQDSSFKNAGDILGAIGSAPNHKCIVTSALIVPKSNFVLSGNKFEADIHMVVYDSCSPYEVVINDQRVKATYGITKYEAVVGDEGQLTIGGYIDYEATQLPFETTVTVYKASATVSAEKMNVLYIGLDNPISIAVPGFPPDKVSVTISGGLIFKTSSNNYIARVRTHGEATVNVSIKNDDGSVRAMGSAKFRVRKLPIPGSQLGTLLNGGTEPVEVIKKYANQVYASQGEGFPIEGIKYTVNKFTVTIAYKDNKGMESVEVTGDKLNDKATELINKMKPGDKIIIDSISVTGPDGERTASPFIVTAK